MNKQSNAETATDIGGSPAALQEQQQKPNVQDEPTAESRSAPAAEAALEPQAGGGSAPSPCSAWRETTHENGLISFAMGNSFGGISSNREKIEWLKKFMES